MAQESGKKYLFIDRLIDLAGQTEIAHHIPGRIRLKVKLSGLLLAQDLEAADLMKYFIGILDTRTNAAARSITISYDVRVISPDMWERLIMAKNHPSLREAVKEDLKRLSRHELESCAPRQL